MLLRVKIEGLGYREVIWALYSYSEVVATRSMFLLGGQPSCQVLKVLSVPWGIDSVLFISISSTTAHKVAYYIEVQH